MILRSCYLSERNRARCGDSKSLSRISRCTLLRTVRMPFSTRSSALHLWCPSLDQSERFKIGPDRIQENGSDTLGLGPRPAFASASESACDDFSTRK
jgi:hypothetical protein